MNLGKGLNNNIKKMITSGIQVQGSKLVTFNLVKSRIYDSYI